MSTSSDDEDVYGPRLPPMLPRRPAPSSQHVIGPMLPANLKKPEEEPDLDADGPQIGPLPAGQSDPLHRSCCSRKPAQADSAPKREQWMTELPEKVERRLGFKSVTSFSKRPVGPAAPPPPEASDIGHVAEEEESGEERKRQGKSRVSLLDQHQEKLKRKRVEAAVEKQERTPFDPEKDLQVRKLDQRQTRSIIDGSKLLNTRFSRGPSKFL